MGKLAMGRQNKKGPFAHLARAVKCPRIQRPFALQSSTGTLLLTIFFSGKVADKSLRFRILFFLLSDFSSRFDL